MKNNEPGPYRHLKQLPWAKIPVQDGTGERSHGRYDIRRFQAITMATLRNTAISLLHLAGITTIAKALRHNARNPYRPLRLLGIG